MKKIKSVKLARDYLTAKDYCPIGTVLIPCGSFWMVEDTGISNDETYRSLAFHDSDISKNKTGLFSIEYEDTENEALAELITFTKDIQEKYSETNVTKELKKIINKLLYNTQ